MTYTVQEQYTSKNFVAGADANGVWGLGPRKVTSITIHHWGVPGQQFDTVRDFLCTNNTPTSAHYVAQDGLVACIVSPDDCAFHAGNAEGNTFSVGIECRPEATDGDYATIAELIASIRAIYGDIPLYPHNHWYNTACPGDYDLARLDSLARGSAITVQGSTITPLQEDALTPELAARLDEIVGYFDGKFKALEGQAERNRDLLAGWVRDNVPAAVLSQEFPTQDGKTANLSGMLLAIHAQPAAAAGPTATADPLAVVHALRDQLNK